MNKEDTVAIIRSLLSSTNSSYSIYNLNKDFKNETGIDIPLYGCNNVSHFLSSIPETVKVTGIYPIERVSLVINQKSAHIVSLVKRQKCTGPKKKYFYRPKPVITKTAVDTSFRSEDIQDTQIVYEKKDFSEFKEQNGSFKNEISSSIKEMPSRDLFLPLKPSKGLIPSIYFCCPEEIIPPINIELHARVGEYAEVVPCYIINPHKFYFHFRKLKKKFSKFFEKLQLFYSTHEIPTIKKDMIRPKLACVGFHKIFDKPEWHRVEIQKMVSNCQVIVNFIDYGNTAKICRGNLKLLHRNFASLPKQAVLGFLANIRPLGGGSKWSLCAIKKFDDLAFQKALVAGVVEVDCETCCMKMALSCTKNSEIHINDTLVKEGYAEFNVDALDSNFTDILMSTNFRSEAIEDFNLSELVLHGNMNNNEESNKSCLKSIRNSTSPILRTPIYFSDNNNNRLKKMFSLVK